MTIEVSSVVGCHPGSTSERVILSRLKLHLLHHGCRVSPKAAVEVMRRGKRPRRVRSGSCGGLDIVLESDVHVNVPVDEAFAEQSPFELRQRDNALVLHRDDGGLGDGVTLDLVPEPAFQLDPPGADGAIRIGQVCFDRLGIGLTNLCTFWRGADRRCKFCSIGLNLGQEERTKGLDEIVRVVDLAYSDSVSPARHLLLGGGTPPGDDAGGAAIAVAAETIKQRWPDRAIYAMLAAPRDLGVLEVMAAAGVDEVGMNLELFDSAMADHFLPGKHRELGRDRYLGALERAVELFGPVHTRSILIVGLEPTECTLAGVDALASRGVMPILSPFRPLGGTVLADHPRPDPEAMWDLAAAATEVAGAYGVPIGPTCRACQANTITPADHALYRVY